jgi:hypothetical protein
MITSYSETIANGEYYKSSWLHTAPIPDSLKTVSVDIFEKILHIAAQTIADFQQTDLQGKIQVVLAQQESQSEKKVKTLITKKDEELATLQRSTDLLLQKLRGELEVASHVSDSLNSKLKVMETDSQKKLQLEMKHLREEKESQYEREIARMQAQNREFTSLLQESLDKQYAERLKAERDVLAKSWAKLEEEKLSLQTQVNRASSTRGQEGEEWFDELVLTKTNWGGLLNTSKQAHATDRSGKIGKCNVLFEIKNYTSTIPTKELEKFSRDMEENSNYPFGVFISRNTGITGMKNFLRVEWTKKGQLLLYVANMVNHGIEDILAYIEACSLCATQIYTLYNELQNTKEESHAVHELQIRLDTAKLYVERDIKRISELLQQMRHDEKFLTDTVKKQYTSYKIQLDESKQSLQDILRILLNTERSEEEHVIQENIGIVATAPAAVPKTKKKAANGTKTTQA